jgi:phenylalanyl-tRNA synthetase alpha chain
MQDSFSINENTILRSHTSSVQARVLAAAKGQGPIKVICPGKVYRRDNDATHSHQFGQIEGLVISEDATFANLLETLTLLLRHLFGEKREVRFRPSFFPFTEPSVEVDVSCGLCGGKGCPTCKGTGWIEVLGAGMVNDNVLRMSGYDPKEIQGFAFGIGVERITMMKYKIDDIRNFYLNDVRFLHQFKEVK